MVSVQQSVMFGTLDYADIFYNGATKHLNLFFKDHISNRWMLRFEILKHSPTGFKALGFNMLLRQTFIVQSIMIPFIFSQPFRKFPFHFFTYCTFVSNKQHRASRHSRKATASCYNSSRLAAKALSTMPSKGGGEIWGNKESKPTYSLHKFNTKCSLTLSKGQGKNYIWPCFKVMVMKFNNKFDSQW